MWQVSGPQGPVFPQGKAWPGSALKSLSLLPCCRRTDQLRGKALTVAQFQSPLLQLACAAASKGLLLQAVEPHGGSDVAAGHDRPAKRRKVTALIFYDPLQAQET